MFAKTLGTVIFVLCIFNSSGSEIGVQSLLATKDNFET